MQISTSESPSISLGSLLQEEFDIYLGASSAFFDYLSNQSIIGFTPTQFAIYRDNFFYRTINTIPSITKVLLAAAYHEDIETLADAGKNLFDETGSGNHSMVHSSLLVTSHNVHAKKVFGLKPISLIDAQTSIHILDVAKAFCEKQRMLYENSSYPIVLAASYAQETAATSMLTTFYEHFFCSYKGFYSQKEFETLTIYFSCHINGVEKDHAEKAQRALLRACNTKSDIEFVLWSVNTFLRAQSDLWNGLLRAMISVEGVERSIPGNHS
ncbi:MAG: hypothetical protein LCI00_32785 [Chloroflexi bacterium]|nr:hypothetical protein [Chloroflexota bacterium]MCC6895460.1 hypothetical protein [Anaerolineae bacterium]